MQAMHQLCFLIKKEDMQKSSKQSAFYHIYDWSL